MTNTTPRLSALPTAEQIRTKLSLGPHLNGGWFKETHRDEMLVSHLPLPFPQGGSRNASTAIIVLLPADITSGMHRVRSDEVYHYYLGTTSLIVHEFNPNNGQMHTISIGNDILNGEQPQYVFTKGNYWMTQLKDNEPGNYVLFGATVSPGFDVQDFEMPQLDEMISKFPQHAATLNKLMKH